MIFESLDAGEVENHSHEKQMQPQPICRSDHQTSFFAHEVFEYFLPAQKVFCPAGKGGEAKTRAPFLNDNALWLKIARTLLVYLPPDYFGLYKATQSTYDYKYWN